MTSLLPPSDGSILPQSFAVASNYSGAGTTPATNSAYIAYKTTSQIMKEIEYTPTGGWGLPNTIRTSPKVVPGDDFALTYGAVSSDERLLIFMEPTGSGYLMSQRYDPSTGSWGEARRFFTAANDDREEFRAHPDSKIAATYNRKLETVYVYATEQNGDIIELVGKKVGGPDTEYYWNDSQGPRRALPTGYLAVCSDKENTQLIYTRTDQSIYLATFTHPIVAPTDGTGTTFTTKQIRAPGESMRTTPLAIATRADMSLTAFYVIKESREPGTILALDITNTATAITVGKPERVGKKEPDSVLGVAYFGTNTPYDSRLLSVSKLDGDDVLLERIEKVSTRTTPPTTAWTISGGIVDTEVTI